MTNISYLLAFTAGLFSFFSPCILPLIPAYLSYITGETIEELINSKNRILSIYRVLGFILGFSIVFILLGASATFLGNFLNSNKRLFSIISGIIMLVLGLHIAGIIKIRWLFYEKKVIEPNKIRTKSIFSSIIVGISFSLGWTPCIGPVLSGILTYASNAKTISTGISLLTMYSLGLAIPFIITSFALNFFLKYLKNIYKYYKVISFISGFIIMFLGILMVFNKTTIFIQ